MPSTPTPQPTPRPQPIIVADLPARVTFLSDDPTVDGQPAAGAVVRFNMLRHPASGPGEVVADAEGRAGTFGPVGVPVTLAAMIAIGPRAGDAVETTIRAGMAPVELRVAKNSPLVTVRMESDLALPERVRVRYTLDGQPGSQEIALLVPGIPMASVRFSVRLPDDATHRLVLSGVDAAGQTTLDVAPREGLDVQRNGSYGFDARLAGIAPK